MTMVQAQSIMKAAPRITVIDPRPPEQAKLRVAAYARVSSDSEDQLNSYIAQVDFYTKYISSKEDWEMVDIYADEGLTGTEAQKRDDFNRMINDCRAGKIDRLLVKSVSRFARNTGEYIQFMRELLRLGISIYFEKENLDTAKMTSEQAADLYGAFAQMESTNHSSNMRVSNRIRMEKGIFTPPTPPYGYRLVERELEIDRDEADVVRYIFRAYLDGQGKEDIAKELNELGVVRGHGRERWYPSTIHYILTNISYTGNMIWQKTCATDTFPFRQIRNTGQKPQYFVEDSHPAIVSQEDFQRVRELMARRREQFLSHAQRRPLYTAGASSAGCAAPCAAGRISAARSTGYATGTIRRKAAAPCPRCRRRRSHQRYSACTTSWHRIPPGYSAPWRSGSGSFGNWSCAPTGRSPISTKRLRVYQSRISYWFG